MAEIITVNVLARENDNAPIDTIALAGELLAPGLAITPALLDGALSGGWTVTHLPSGKAVSAGAGACLACLRFAAKALVEADVDWTRDGDAIKDDPAASRAGHEFGSAAYECGGVDCEASHYLPAAA
ncbi:hypothetical protein ABZ814_22745 [Micromonospora musae]|uniref:hypothetical protein n=1 Tax=Micromonospora musae TaxID=1894970 RepID=UPI0033FACCED